MPKPRLTGAEIDGLAAVELPERKLFCGWNPCRFPDRRRSRRRSVAQRCTRRQRGGQRDLASTWRPLHRPLAVASSRGGIVGRGMEDAYAAAAIPRRPSGVEPEGRLQGSGFAERQWLLRRDRQFVQVGDLLYRARSIVPGSISSYRSSTRT